MDKGRKFQPWILGGLSMATLAFAISVGWTQDIAPNNAAAAPVSARTPAPAPTLAAAQIHRMTPPTEQHRQIWECTINGQKTFSDYRCGDKASLREIGPINIMDPTPVLPHSRSYVQESSGQPRDSDPSQQADSYPSEQQSADNSYPVDDSYPGDGSYPVFIGNPFGERRRPDHEERRRSDHEDRPQSHQFTIHEIH
jgi:hypothetical protein